MDMKDDRHPSATEGEDCRIKLHASLRADNGVCTETA